jgi:hypothetical protein
MQRFPAVVLIGNIVHIPLLRGEIKLTGRHLGVNISKEPDRGFRLPKFACRFRADIFYFQKRLCGVGFAAAFWELYRAAANDMGNLSSHVGKSRSGVGLADLAEGEEPRA